MKNYMKLHKKRILVKKHTTVAIAIAVAAAE